MVAGVEFTRHASQFIGCVNALLVEMKRCVELEKTFPVSPLPSPELPGARGEVRHSCSDLEHGGHAGDSGEPDHSALLHQRELPH